MTEKDRDKEMEAWKYAEKAMTWYGWGSPIGLGIFIIAIGVFIVLLHAAGLW
jgi:hypothetical protein